MLTVRTRLAKIRSFGSLAMTAIISRPTLSFWRILSSTGGPGHALDPKSELTEARWRIYSDNIENGALAAVHRAGVTINTELRDLSIAVTDAQFSKSGDMRDFWTERLNTRDEEIVLTWYQLGEPFWVDTQPNTIPGRPYGMCTVFIPALWRTGRPAMERGELPHPGRGTAKVVPPALAYWGCARVGRRRNRPLPPG